MPLFGPTSSLLRLPEGGGSADGSPSPSGPEVICCNHEAVGTRTTLNVGRLPGLICEPGGSVPRSWVPSLAGQRTCSRAGALWGIARALTDVMRKEIQVMVGSNMVVAASDVRAKCKEVKMISKQ